MPNTRSKCLVVAQAILRGTQTVRVRSFPAEAGWRQAYISVRIGDVLINIEDPEALASLTEAVRAANHHGARTWAVTPRTGA